MLFHLFGQILAGLLVGEVQAHLVDQPLLVLEPGRLSTEATTTVVRSLAPDADAEACRSCYAATGGNAFYVREVAAAIRDREPSVESQSLDAWSPESVTRTVAARIAEAECLDAHANAARLRGELS